MRALQLHCNDIDAHEAALDAQIRRLDRAREQVEAHLRDKDEGEQVRTPNLTLAPAAPFLRKRGKRVLARSFVLQNAVGHRVPCLPGTGTDPKDVHTLRFCCRLMWSVRYWMAVQASTGHPRVPCLISPPCIPSGPSPLLHRPDTEIPTTWQPERPRESGTRPRNLDMMD